MDIFDMISKIMDINFSFYLPVLVYGFVIK